MTLDEMNLSLAQRLAWQDRPKNDGAQNRAHLWNNLNTETRGRYRAMAETALEFFMQSEAVSNG